MSVPCSAGSGDSTQGSPEPDSLTPSSANPTSGDEGFLPPGSPESPSGTTYELFVSNQRREVREMEVAPALTEPGGFTQAPFLLISSAVDFHARTSPSPAVAPDSKPENDRPSSSSSCGSPTTLFNPEGMSSLRTYPDYFPAKADEISLSYSRRWPSSGFTTSPGVCWTADISECPSGGGVSSCLADVLQDSVAPKYFLSPRAAAGILRRAEKRGRELPSHLRSALSQVAKLADGESDQTKQPEAS